MVYQLWYNMGLWASYSNTILLHASREYWKIDVQLPCALINIWLVGWCTFRPRHTWLKAIFNWEQFKVARQSVEAKLRILNDQLTSTASSCFKRPVRFINNGKRNGNQAILLNACWQEENQLMFSLIRSHFIATYDDHTGIYLLQIALCPKFNPMCTRQITYLKLWWRPHWNIITVSQKMRSTTDDDIIQSI